jgi:DNA-binding MarR family transcriptional regulator
LVRRDPDPADRRRVIVRLTRRGRRLESVVPAILAEVTELATVGMTESERADLVRLLGEVRESVRPAPTAHS